MVPFFLLYNLDYNFETFLQLFHVQPHHMVSVFHFLLSETQITQSFILAFLLQYFDNLHLFSQIPFNLLYRPVTSLPSP